MVCRKGWGFLSNYFLFLLLHELAINFCIRRKGMNPKVVTLI